MTKIPGFYTRKEAAAYVRLSVPRLAQLAQAGGELVPCRYIGRMVLYSQEQLDQFLAKRQARPDLRTPSGEPAYTINEVAALTGLSWSALYQQIKAGTLPAYRRPHGYGPLGERYLIPASVIDRGE